MVFKTNMKILSFLFIFGFIYYLVLVFNPKTPCKERQVCRILIPFTALHKSDIRNNTSTVFRSLI